MKPRVILKTHTGVRRPGIFSVLVARCTSATQTAYEEDVIKRLAAELRERLRALASRLDAVEDLAPVRLETERERLRRSVAELAGGVEIDDDRLAREIAVLADRWDIREEIVRARAHIEAFSDLLELPDEEPVGKRLGFLSQELLREINTIGSKGNDSGIAHHIVEAKNELESMREQIENVE